jgi:hypothetical protein
MVADAESAENILNAILIFCSRSTHASTIFRYLLGLFIRTNTVGIFELRITPKSFSIWVNASTDVEKPTRFAFAAEIMPQSGHSIEIVASGSPQCEHFVI